MSRTYGFALAFLLISAGPALADVGRCGDAPLPPAILSAAEIGQKAPAAAAAAKHQAFLDVKSWQKSLKSYRSCLDTDVAQDKQAIATLQASSDKGAKDKIAALDMDANAANDRYNHTIDTEKNVVGEFIVLSNAYCARTDVDRATCPKKQ